MILAIDIGPKRSAWILCYRAKSAKQCIHDAMIEDNGLLIESLHRCRCHDKLELRDVVTTLAIRQCPLCNVNGVVDVSLPILAGRFIEACGISGWMMIDANLIRLSLCGKANVEDRFVRQVLIEKYGVPGREVSPGPTYMVKSGMWNALATADYVRSHWAVLHKK